MTDNGIGQSTDGSERRSIGQEVVLRVRTTRKGAKVVELDGVGFDTGYAAKRNRNYWYGDDAEEKATDYAYRKQEEIEDARDVQAVVVELGEVMGEKLTEAGEPLTEVGQ